MDGIVLAILAFVPLFILGAYLARANFKLLFFGSVGWILALTLRIIPLNLFQLYVRDIAIVIIYSAILAGLFEEGVRFWFVKRTKTSDLKTGLTFGLGWGIAEALVLFFPSLLLAQLPLAASFLDLLPGIVERYVAVLAHISLTFIIMKGLVYREYILVAVSAHVVLDLVAGFTYYVMRLSVWQVEGLVAAYVILLATYAQYIQKKVY
ncbi:MAG: YhfC family glutamic-type intramembrane protease [Candidatus Methanomethylicaceae archaeon]